jgi:hypothetical protein
MARKPREVETAVEIEIPDIQVLDRAIADPFGMPSHPILLKDPKFVCRWVNTELKGGSQLTSALNAGYLKAKPEYLADPEGFHWNTSPDGYVTRGERHREILMYTTTEHHKRRAWAKTERNLKAMRAGKGEIQEAASKQFGKDGDRAAEFLGRHIGGVSDYHETIAVDPNGDAA